MVAYAVEVSVSASKTLAKLPRADRNRLRAAVEQLAIDPRPHGTAKLSGTKDGYRIRVGNFRVVYTINDGALVVVVIRVGHRREVYR